MSAFNRLHPKIQKWLWDQGWQTLRPLQTEAIEAVFTQNSPLLLCAATASGKTEAAFLPILSRLTENENAGIKALYIGPLRALINDQFSRLEDLCEGLEIPVHKWHGDVSADAKRKLVEKPNGVLLLTPESLESLFINRSAHLEKLFQNLEWIVIDELHVFLGQERGRHLRSLLSRLEAFSQTPARRVGLSATLSQELSAAREFLAPRGREIVGVITDETKKGFGIRVHGFEEHETPTTTDELPTEREIARAIRGHFAGKTSLIFCNARGDAEVLADLCLESGWENEVFVHHGSLSRELREDAEAALKHGSKSCATTAFCSATLELGIDLGQVEAVAQVGAPFSVASFKQRLGRSGRRENQARQMRVYLQLEAPTPSSSLFERLCLPLAHTVAATQLMLEGWVETPREASLDFSTLTQQILSVIAQTGGISAAKLYAILCANGAFSQVEKPLFAALLRCLGSDENDILEQSPNGDLILGLRGERLRHSRDFYATFLTPREYAILHKGKNLGSLPLDWAPPPGEHLVFAGKRWLIEEVESDKMQIHVVPARGKKRPKFASAPGDVDSRLRWKMKHVLGAKSKFPYLDKTAGEFFERAQSEFERLGLKKRAFVPISDGATALFFWSGDRETLGARLLLGQVGLSKLDFLEAPRGQDGVGIVVKRPERELRNLVARAAHLDISALDLATQIPDKVRRKYDEYLSDELLAQGFARDFLDLESSRALLKGCLAF